MRVADVFDEDRFIRDFRAYLTRQKISMHEMLKQTPLNRKTYRLTVMERRNQVTLPTAIILADFADLSLDDYRRQDYFQ